MHWKAENLGEEEGEGGGGLGGGRGGELTDTQIDLNQELKELYIL